MEVSGHFGDTEAEVVNLLAKTNFQSFHNVFGAFGFFKARCTPEDADKYLLDPYTPLPLC
jgi:hypothetical protein